ncbi:MAG: type 4a pilus biogenesis protein PilO [Patescibacteria group bacterium]|nr:type 4a pilus biogenesis protein PilO [Patescibacteria group bacterium]
MEKITIAQKNKIQQDNQQKQKINTLLIKYFKWLIFGVLTIILAAGYFLLIQPKYKQVAKDAESISEGKQLKYLTQQKYLNRLNELKAVYQSIKIQDRDKIEAILPNQAEIDKLFTEIEAIALSNGLILTSLQFESVKSAAKIDNKYVVESAKANQGSKDKINDLPEEIAKIKIIMNLVGTDYNGLKNILKTIERNLRLMDIIKLSFSPNDNQTSLELLAYYMK